MPPTPDVDNGREGQFAATRWTVVLAAGDPQVTEQRAWDALSELCRIYWRPLYLFLRRQGHSAEEAQDLTQGFFAELIRDRTYRRADRDKGRFRSFLLGTLKHYVSDVRDGQRALKRGGGKIHELLDEDALAEVEAKFSTAQNWNATTLFDREWAAALLRQTFNRLAEESAIAGKTALFDGLRPYLAGSDEEQIPYDEIAQRLHRNTGTLRSDVARLRTRYRRILREEVGGTVAEPAEVNDELRYLCRVLAES